MEAEKPFKDPPWDDALVLGTAAELSVLRVEQGSGWERDTGLEMDNQTSSAGACGFTGFRPRIFPEIHDIHGCQEQG